MARGVLLRPGDGGPFAMGMGRAVRLVRQTSYRGRLVARSVREEGLGFLNLWPRVQLTVPGWLTPADGRLLYALAHHGPGRGAIVEIGSAWGKSTIHLAQGTKAAGREKVYAIDPHTGDPWFIADTGLKQFDSFGEFSRNICLFDVTDWVVPVVATSAEAARTVDTGPIRLLYLDGLHTYEGVKRDIADWVPRVVPGGVIIFDDYLNGRPGVGVRAAVDELLASGAVEPRLAWARWLCWTTRRANAVGEDKS
jgi:hypothetical protein